MSILGISAGFHDAAATIINTQGDILYAGHGERYSKKKNDPNLCREMMWNIWGHDIKTVAYYERPIAKQLRQLYSGQGIEWNKLSVKSILEEQCKPFHIVNVKIKNYNHHLCHTAAGFQTSTFSRATVVVIDAIGEWDTISIWGAEYDREGVAKYKKLWGQKYPHSIGLFYSAMTQRAGLKPNEEEYILMGMSAYGERGFAALMEQDHINHEYEIKFNENLHLGIAPSYLNHISNEDIAAGAQELAEQLILNVMARAKKFQWSEN